MKPDLVFEEGDALVVAEVEVELDYEAIGQSLTHAWIYERSKRLTKEVISCRGLLHCPYNIPEIG